jgi:hypothetical protein
MERQFYKLPPSITAVFFLKGKLSPENKQTVNTAFATARRTD